MDPLDVLTNKQNIIPFYQPIFSADEQVVIGYEVLGRFKDDHGIHSLGPFFHDDSIPDEYQIEVDGYIQNQALEYMLQHDDLLIFLNRNANLLMNEKWEDYLTFLQSFEERGLSLDRIVIEITEHRFTGDIEQLNHILMYYRTYGIQLAIDNVGKGGSNLDRLRLLKPDILKIDLNILKQTTEPQSHQDVLQSLSLLSRKIGATLLYEDVEASYQLQYAWRNGGRYYQGYYFAEPTDKVVQEDLCKDKMKNEFHRFILHEKKKLQQQYEITENFNERLQGVHFKIKDGDFEQTVQNIAYALTDCSFRVYICDEDGFQRSSNIRKIEGKWSKQPEFKGKNWSWRPYFLENIVRMNYVKKGMLSELYSDMETGESIRTFSYPVGQSYYAFIDLPYEFIYKNDALL